MDDAEVGLILKFLGLEELGVRALLLQHLLHKALVRGLGEPALLIQQGQDTRGVVLVRTFITEKNNFPNDRSHFIKSQRTF